MNNALLIHAIGQTGHKQKFFYNPQTSALTFECGSAVPIKPVGEGMRVSSVPAPKFNNEMPIKISKKIERLTIKIDCEKPKSLDLFLETLKAQIQTKNVFLIDFWAREPLENWGVLKELAEKLQSQYPQAQFSISTNGLLLTRGKNEWLNRLNFKVEVKHDAGTQYLNGFDPLDSPVAHDAILNLFEMLHPKQKISFKAKLHSQNIDRAAIQSFLIELTGDKAVTISDDEGASFSFNESERPAIRANLFAAIGKGEATNFSNVNEKIVEFINATAAKRQAKTIDTTPSHLFVDLNGNIFANAHSKNKIGALGDLDNIEANTATHWDFRKGCSTCPALQICKGGDVFLNNEEFDQKCKNNFDVNIAYFIAAFEHITHGYRPVFIDGDLPNGHKDLWGCVFKKQVQAAGEQQNEG